MSRYAATHPDLEDMSATGILDSILDDYTEE
jgi:hypothetical protein